MRKLYLLLCITVSAILLSPARSTAQITVTPGATAAILANELVGSGVAAWGATLSCSTVANGTFIGTSTLPFDSGIVLTSGRAQTVGTTWGSNAAASNFASLGMGLPGDPQLTALAGVTTRDACILEFNFRPTGDTVKFNYVFGSEEYPEWACGSVNDAFAFFITGPGYGAPTNLAVVPGTTIPVSINSVNSAPIGTGFPIANCNAMGPGSPFNAYYVNNSTSPSIVYDGTTVEMTAIAAVTPCDTYHLKIAIADGGDDVYDSGVFLKAGSLSSTGLTIVPQGMNPGDTTMGGEYAVRGCQPGKFVFGRDGVLTSPFTIHYIIGGTAVNGYDYATIADSVVIPAGDSLFTLNINPLLVPAAGPKIVTIYILSPYTCGSGLPIIMDSASITILDSFFLRINTSDTAICNGQYVDINAVGDPLLTYSWAPSGTLSNPAILNPRATPTMTTTYIVTGVFPGGGCPPTTDIFTITVYNPPAVSVGAPVKNTCLGVGVPLDAVASPVASYYNYYWTPGTDLSSTTIKNPTVTPTSTGDRYYYVTVGTPVPGCSTTDSFLLHVLPNDFTLLSQDTGICYPPATYQIRAEGDTEFSYRWIPNHTVINANSLTAIVAPDATTIYTVIGSYPGCPDMVHTVLFSIQHPQVDILMGDTTICLDLPMTLPVRVTPVDSPYTFTWLGSPTGLLDATVLQPDFQAPTGTYNYSIVVQSGLGCSDTDAITITSAPPVHIAAGPQRTTIKYGEQVQLEAINLTVNPLRYMWEPHDGSLDNPNINNPIAKPTDSTTYIVYGMNEWGCRDTAEVTINVDGTMSECIPSAFTPNGDGRNDVFRLLCNKHQRLVDMRVFNRWGQVIFESNNADKGWDGTFNGTPQDMGVYHFMIVVARPNQGGNKTYKGDITLIR